MFPQARRDGGRASNENLRNRVDELERTQRRLEHTVRGLAREMEASVGCLCPRCDEAYMIQTDGVMYCPACRNRTSI
ncbi:hypothetical protein EA472_20995 [Natrarchaeobius oligotrophus]|uniref:Uncharacterized protein n=1 Tax=Natrarchaeobius chitinivorans TaxID=1679083 RepID=A0A3N6PF50_NATCH|nr:hypothetical protein EA472_20995 [Natrarchaeobius chitinivorans]